MKKKKKKKGKRVENPSRKKKSQQQIPFSEIFRFFRSNPSTKVGTDKEEEEEFRTQTNNNNLFRARVSNYNDDMQQATTHTLLKNKELGRGFSN